MFNQTIAKQGSPKYLSSDDDPLFEYHQWQANLRILEIEEIKTVPYVPLSQPFVERLIGTVRREFLDHVLVWNATDLQRKLDTFQTYYSTERVHAARDRQPPVASLENPCSLRNFRWRRCCRGLYELPMEALIVIRHLQVKKRWQKWLNRRSRRAAMPWERFQRLLQRYRLPPPRVLHSIYVAKP